MLAITILDCAGAGKKSVIGGSTISLFAKNGLFRQGMFDLRVWIGIEADGNQDTTTPGKFKDTAKNQMQRLAKLAKKHRNGQIPKVDWLDRLTFREIEMINEKEKTESDYLYLLVEFPTINCERTNQTFSIVYFEPDGDQKYSFNSKPNLVTVPDTEILQENLVERKHHRLARSARSGLSDRDAKPTAAVRDQLHTIVYRYPPTAVLTSEEQDLVWKFRFYLTSHKKALTKFLKCINWETVSEVRQALNLLNQWTPMDVEDALELLSPTFTHPAVRGYAISRLKQAPDDDLVLYLLQLVQALKYESFSEIDVSFESIFAEIFVYSVFFFDFQEAYKKIVTENEAIKSIDDTNMESSSTVDGSPSENQSRQSTTPQERISVNSKRSDESVVSAFEAWNLTNTLIGDSMASTNTTFNLATFLIQRACRNSTLSNYLYWYLYIECEPQDTVRQQDEAVKNMYEKVLQMFKRTLQMTSELRAIRTNLEKQQLFIDELVKLVKIVAKESGNRKKKCEKFQQLLADNDAFRIHFSSFESIPLPLDPDVTIRGIVPSKVSLFKSALMPSK